MGKKAAARSPYFFYMVEYQKLNQTNHRMDELMLICADSWTKMSPRDREIYEKMAKAHKTGQQSSPPSRCSYEKYTSQNVPLSLIEKGMKLAVLKNNRMNRHILQLLEENPLKEQIFHFIHFNYFCKTLDNFVPAEVCVLKFSLLNGIEDYMHSFINPEEIPRGLAYEAQYHTTSTHKLPLPPHAKGDIDFVVINKILDFVRDDKGLPPLFTLTDNIEMTEKILATLVDSTQDGAVGARNSDPEQFLVYPLSQLLFEMKNLTSVFATDRLKSIHIAQSLLLSDRYDYSPGIACEYHIIEDADRYCSQSCVKRYAFVVSDVCCMDLDIKFIPGQHLPIEADLSSLNAPGAFSPASDTSIFMSCSSDNDKASNNTMISEITDPVQVAYEYAASDIDTMSNFTSVSQRPPQNSSPKPLRLLLQQTCCQKMDEVKENNEDIEHVLNSTNPFAIEIYQKRMKSQANSSLSLNKQQQQPWNTHQFSRSVLTSRDPFIDPQSVGHKRYPRAVETEIKDEDDERLTDLESSLTKLSIGSSRSGLGRGIIRRKFE